MAYADDRPAPDEAEDGASMEKSAGTDTSVSEQQTTQVMYVRKRFPETFIWQYVDMFAGSQAHVPKTVPDTITTWELYGYAVHPDRGIIFGENGDQALSGKFHR